MDWRDTLETVRLWLIDMDAWPQRAIWAGAVLIAGGLTGWAAGSVFRRSASRFLPAPEVKGEENQLAALMASAIRIGAVLSAAAFAADILGVLELDQSTRLAQRGLSALAILVAAWFLAAWLSARIRRFGERAARMSADTNTALFAFLASLVRWAALAVALIVALQQFGFQTASLIAVVGAAGLAVALALQDTLKAVAAGVMIAIARPFRIGDFVRISGEEGSVDNLSPFSIVLKTLDNREVTIPNDQAWAGVVVNYSARERRRIDLVFSISYDDDIDHALDVLVRTVGTDPRVIHDPPIWAKVAALSASSVDLRVRAWCLNDDYVDLRGDLLKSVKQAFDREGVSIPYPHQVSINKGDMWDRLGAMAAPAASSRHGEAADPPGLPARPKES